MLNVFTGRMDYYEDVTAEGDERYLRKDQDDTTVGSITIKPAEGNAALIIQKGKRLVLDGE
jgi:hypothetical protein